MRVDDIDPPRVAPGSAERIFQTLKQFGIAIDGDLIFQATNIDNYINALQQLIELDVLFACTCARHALKNGNTCQANCITQRLSPLKPLREQLRLIHGQAAVRLDITHAQVQQTAPFTVRDRIQPNQYITDFSTFGNPVIWRKDGCVSYLLATSVDDSDGITDVVRGADLWQGSTLQQLVMQLLKRPVPIWAHIPCVLDNQKLKLGKRTRASSIHDEAPLPLLQNGWRFLGQRPIPCGTLEEFWEEAAATWSIDLVPKEQALTFV